MGRWAARYAEKLAAPLQGSTDKTDERGVLSVLAVTPEGGACEIQAARMLASKSAENAEAPDLAAVAWTDTDVASYLARHVRLLRWGWPEAEAERWATRLVQRDRDGDPRVSCADCRHYRPGRCGNHTRAGLQAPAVSRDLAALLQRCSGFGDAKPQ